MREIDTDQMPATPGDVLGRDAHKRIYFDLPGHGATPTPEWLSTQDQMLAIVRDFIDVLLPEGSFAIAGSSHGGHVAPGSSGRSPTG